jgi:GMP synthase-like glutamine amidotransferase
MRVLSVVHEPGPYGGGGLFEARPAELGHGHQRWLVPTGPPPDEPARFDAIMVFGGSMHPDQDELHPWLAGEAEFIRDALDASVSLLGVCLGSQLIARAADGGVHPSDAPEIGWGPVELTAEGIADPVLGALPPRFTAFSWHYYSWRLPAGGVLLASSPASTQAYRLGDRVWGVQFHPEVTGTMLEGWYHGGEEQLPMPVDDLRRETKERLPSWNAQGLALVDAFLREASLRPGVSAGRR